MQPEKISNDEGLYISDADLENDTWAHIEGMYIYYMGNKYLIQRAANEGYWVKQCRDN